MGVSFLVKDSSDAESSRKSSLVIQAAAQTHHAQSQVNTALHARSCVRAMDKIQVMREDAVNPAEAQQYLSRWASWWARTAPITSTHCLTRWVQQALKHQPDLCWLASGILALR